MKPVLKSRRFETDFVERALYLSEANSSAGLRFVNAVEEAISLLAKFPEMGPVWRYSSPAHPTRYLSVPGFHNYLIFYRYEAEEIRLGRLLHGAMDLRDVLED